MNKGVATDLEQRVLLLAPTRRDASTGEKVLQRAGLAYKVCPSLADLCQEMPLGAGAVILPEEAIARDQAGLLKAALQGQPAWSSLPILILTAAGRRPAKSLEELLEIGEVSLLRRPLQLVEFLNAVRTALRDRARQYFVRDHLHEQAEQAAALREADRRKDEFLAMLAHELRNPLSPIRNGLQILKYGGGQPSDVEQTLEMMDRQVQHLARLVDDLLDVSRITRGVAELRMEEVDLNVVILRAVETARPLIESRRHTLTISQPGHAVWVWADLTRMTQVIGNLLNNAAKYSEDHAQIRIELRQEGTESVIAVCDTGVGIPPEMLPKVFELFTQVDRTLDRSQGGLGIGLTLVRRLVEMHEGSVEARSEGINCGSEFVVRLPLLETGGRRSLKSQQGGSTNSERFRILVVDDNADAGKSLAQVLRLSGHQVQVAQSGYKALELSKEFMPEVALLDIGLPGMDGYELARALRTEQRDRPLQLIALTGYGQEEDRRRTQQAGFDYHLTKPADLEELFALLQTATHDALAD